MLLYPAAVCHLFAPLPVSMLTWTKQPKYVSTLSLPGPHSMAQSHVRHQNNIDFTKTIQHRFMTPLMSQAISPHFVTSHLCAPARPAVGLSLPKECVIQPTEVIFCLEYHRGNIRVCRNPFQVHIRLSDIHYIISLDILCALCKKTHQRIIRKRNVKNMNAKTGNSDATVALTAGATSRELY